MMPPGKQPPDLSGRAIEAFCDRCGKRASYCRCHEAEPVTHWDWDERADNVLETEDEEVSTEDYSK